MNCDKAVTYTTCSTCFNKQNVFIHAFTYKSADWSLVFYVVYYIKGLHFILAVTEIVVYYLQFQRLPNFP